MSRSRVQQTSRLLKIPRNAHPAGLARTRTCATRTEPALSSRYLIARFFPSVEQRRATKALVAVVPAAATTCFLGCGGYGRRVRRSAQTAAQRTVSTKPCRWVRRVGLKCPAPKTPGRPSCPIAASTIKLARPEFFGFGSRRPGASVAAIGRGVGGQRASGRACAGSASSDKSDHHLAICHPSRRQAAAGNRSRRARLSVAQCRSTASGPASPDARCRS